VGQADGADPRQEVQARGLGNVSADHDGGRSCLIQGEKKFGSVD